MNKHEILVSWQKGLAFETAINGHKLRIDGSPDIGGQDSGPRPKMLMLLSLAGCTGIDVIMILNKMRVELDDFDMKLEADLTDETPSVYTKMHVTYIFKGKDLDEAKLQKAVQLSRNKYCGVSKMYEKAFELTYSIQIEKTNDN